MQIKDKPELNPINQESEVLAKTYQPYLPIKKSKSVAKTYQPDFRPIKERKSVATTLLKIIFIYFPLGLIFFVFIIFPTFFMCNANKAKQSEGKQYLSSINKGQQAYYAENTTFSKSMNALGLGLKTETTNYNYSISATKNAAFNYAVSSNETKILTSYVGAVFLVPCFPSS